MLIANRPWDFRSFGHLGWYVGLTVKALLYPRIKKFVLVATIAVQCLLNLDGIIVLVPWLVLELALALF